MTGPNVQTGVDWRDWGVCEFCDAMGLGKALSERLPYQGAGGQSIMGERTIRAESLSRMFNTPSDHPYTTIEHFFNSFNDFWFASTKQDDEIN